MGEEPILDHDPQVLEIHPEGKYVIIFEERVPPLELERIRSLIEHWQESDHQFLLLSGGVTLQRVDE